MQKIRLTIQEIVNDYEGLVRYDEKMENLFDGNMADDAAVSDFFNYVEGLTEKYLPTYKRHVPKEYFSKGTSEYDKSLILYNMVYENFKEIFYQLV